MKNKKSIYILLPVVLLVWGLVAYQFFSFSSNEVKVGKNPNNFVFKPVQFKPKDTFTINVNYRDPFLGKMYLAQNENASKRKGIKLNKPILKTEPIILQTIVYKGIVSDTKDKTKIFMLIINGHTFLMKKGDSEIDVFLKDGNRESITVKNKGTLQTILLQV
jgi:hypothetical protein